MAGLSPTVRRRRLTAELRRLRESSGRTIDDVAESIGLSKSTLSRMESAQVAVKLPVLRALLAQYHVEGDQARALEQLCREASQRGWWQRVGVKITSEPYKTLIGLEAEASWISYFSATMIIGLLQTEDYARALLRAILFDSPDEEIDAAVTLRLRRQDRLNELQLWVILAEECLLRPIGGAEVMAGQIDRLLAASRERNITIQVVGLESGEHAGTSGGFTMIGFESQFDSGAVYVEGNGWDACVEEPSELVRYTRTFDLLRAVALGPEESRRRLTKILEGYRL